MEYDNISTPPMNDDNLSKSNEYETISDSNSVDKQMRKRMKQYYPSNFNGLNINNAETGEIYYDLVGSKNEKKFFRVIDSTGTTNGSGQICYGIKTSNKLFYKDVNQYISHRNRKYDINNNVNKI